MSHTYQQENDKCQVCGTELGEFSSFKVCDTCRRALNVGDKLKISEVLGITRKNEHCGIHGAISIADMNRGYNHCLDDLDQREIDIEALERLAVDAMKAEQLRNGITLKTHKFSEFCSCGRCHTATVIVQHLADNMKMWIVKKG